MALLGENTHPVTVFAYPARPRHRIPIRDCCQHLPCCSFSRCRPQTSLAVGKWLSLHLGEQERVRRCVEEIPVGWDRSSSKSWRRISSDSSQIVPNFRWTTNWISLIHFFKSSLGGDLKFRRLKRDGFLVESKFMVERNACGRDWSCRLPRRRLPGHDSVPCGWSLCRLSTRPVALTSSQIIFLFGAQ